MTEGSTFGFKGFAILFAILVIGFAGAQSQPGGQFDLLTKIVRKVPTRVVVTTPTPTTPTTPTAPTPSSPTTTASSGAPTTTTSSSNSLYTELTAIPSSFDYNSLLVSTGGLPSSAAPDVVGAFRFMCTPGQLLRDDPIVYPGQPGKSHLHQFYGNLGANANSTYSSLRQSGGSSCEGGAGTTMAVNRSAYWMPAMLDGIGNVVRPDWISIYYKRRPISDPKCHLDSGDPRAEGNCVPLPNGLRFIFGYDMLTGKTPTGAISIGCSGPSAGNGGFSTITAAMAVCPTTPTNGKYNQLTLAINAPECWDGKNLDSPNHRDHVSYFSFNGLTGLYSCPATHPFELPTFRLAVGFTVDTNLGKWHLSSDEMLPGAAAGTTFHADWFGAWDNQIEAMWMDNCINKLLSCSGGDLGNGKQVKGMWGTSWTANPRLVPLASIQ